LERGGLADEVASVSNEDLQSGPSFVGGVFEESEAVDGGAVNC